MQSDEVTNEINEARRRFESAKTASARRDAAEDLEFWTNKNAALHAAAQNGWAA